MLASAPASASNFLTPRPKQPDGFARMAWPEKRAVLFGLFAPSDEEKKLIDQAMPPAQKWAKAKVLLFYRCQYPHASIATGVYTLKKLGEATGAYETTLSEDPDDFRFDNLQQYDAVLLLHTTKYHETIGLEGRAALEAYVKQGGGLVGVHAAADAAVGWREGAAMMGGIFRGHPWLPKDEWAIRLESPGHPLNAAFGGEGFWLADEIYTYRPGTFSRKRSRVLLSLDMTQPHNVESKKIPKKARHEVDPDGDYPVAWAHEWEEGRVFYSNFGHAASTFREPRVLQHYLDGIRYATRQIEADVTPSAELEEIKIAPAPGRD